MRTDFRDIWYNIWNKTPQFDPKDFTNHCIIIVIIIQWFILKFTGSSKLTNKISHSSGYIRPMTAWVPEFRKLDRNFCVFVLDIFVPLTRTHKVAEVVGVRKIINDQSQSIKIGRPRTSWPIRPGSTSPFGFPMTIINLTTKMPLIE